MQETCAMYGLSETWNTARKIIVLDFLEVREYIVREAIKDSDRGRASGVYVFLLHSKSKITMNSRDM